MKPKHLNAENVDAVMYGLMGGAHNNSMSTAARAVEELGREAALELEAIMYLGRGDFETFEQAFDAMNRRDYHATGAASQIAGKGIRAMEYIAIGFARLALDETS